MSRVVILLVVVLVFLLALGGGVWWYFFGPNAVAGAELVPSDTVFFATIPNAVRIATGYQTSNLKTLVGSPNVQPTIDTITRQIGQKNFDLIQAFLPSLSGQSFIAVTHISIQHSEENGVIAAMKPKAGMGDFNVFIQKLTVAYPDFLKESKTGHGTVGGSDYEWIQGPEAGAPKICVLRMSGWIVTASSETTLQDWLERFQHRSATPSLAQNTDYQKSMARVGKDSLASVYVNVHALMDLFGGQSNAPAGAAGALKKLNGFGAAAVGASFEDGDIVDHFSVFMTHDMQVQLGMADLKNSFDTLKFTGPDTRAYLGGCINWQQMWKNLETQNTPETPVAMVNEVRDLAQASGLNVQKNIIGPLGPEFSWQLEWAVDDLYPSIGVLVKLDKPDDFKPTIDAIIEAERKMYSNSATINEVSSNGHKFAALNLQGTLPISPTITEDGDYLGIFLTQNQAVRSFDRNSNSGLLSRADFNHQIGDQRNGATQITYVDTPVLLDRAYHLALPYVSMAAMMNPTVASITKGRTLPPDLTWLAPIGTWSYVSTLDADGITGFSKSGIGNQGLLFGGSLSAGFTAYSMFMPGGVPFPGMTSGPAMQRSPAPMVTAPVTGATSDPSASAAAPSTPATVPAPDATAPSGTPATAPNPDATSTNAPSPEMH